MKILNYIKFSMTNLVILFRFIARITTYHLHFKFDLFLYLVVLVKEEGNRIRQISHEALNAYLFGSLDSVDKTYLLQYITVGCVKPYTVVPKVFRLCLPTPNPIHWT